MGYFSSLNAQTKSLSLASFILGASYFISAILGFLRDRILASSFGASRELDIYYAAFRIPDLIANVLIFGAITAAILPIFSRYWVQSHNKAWRYISNLFNLIGFFIIPFCIVLIILAPLFVRLAAPGFNLEEKELATTLLRIMFFAPLVLGISNIVSGVLQFFKRFIITSIAPILYNLGIIFGALVLSPSYGVLGLAFGVVIGALLHFLIQLPFFFKAGFRPILIFDFKEEGFIDTLRLTAPRSLALGVNQLNLLFMASIASFFREGSIAIFTLSSNLSGTITNLFAVSISAAVFPNLSLAFAKKELKEFKDNSIISLKMLIYLLAPASFFIFYFREELVRIFFGAGKFSYESIITTSYCLAILSISLVFQGLIMVLVKIFYASGNTKTPALISFLSVIFNISLAILFLKTNFFAFFSKDILILPLCVSLSSLFQFWLLAYFIKKELKIDIFFEIKKTFFYSLILSFVMLIFFYAGSLFFNLGDWFLEMLLSLILGFGIFAALSFVFQVPEFKIILSTFLKFFRQNKKS